MRTLLPAEAEDFDEEESSTKDHVVPKRVGCVAVAALAGLAVMVYMSSTSGAKEAVNLRAKLNDDEMMACLPCHGKECTLGGYRAHEWTTCPADKPYFSETHCKCVKSSVCEDDSNRVLECRMCQNCHTSACHIDGESVICSSEHPFHDPKLGSCVETCGQKVEGEDWFPELPTEVPFVCPTNTYGTCSLFGCSASRGPTYCSGGQCICNPGHCAYTGKCMPEEHFDEKEHMCQHNTFRSCRMWGCPSSLGHTVCDGIFGGLGTFQCLCKEGHCFVADENKCIKKK